MPKADAPYPIKDEALAWFSAKERDLITDGDAKLAAATEDEKAPLQARVDTLRQRYEDRKKEISK